MKHIKLICIAILACSFALALGGCSDTPSDAPELKEATISSPAIQEDGVLKVGVNTDKSPLAGMGNDKIIGIDVDVAAAIADELGLKVSIVDVGSSPAKALEDGTVDIVTGIDSSDPVSDIWLSEQYLPTGVSLFTLSDNNLSVPTKDSAPKIAAQVSSKSAWAVTNEFGDEALDSNTDLSSAFDKLSSGSIDYVASDAVIGMYAANRQGVDVKIVALMDNASGYCIGCSKDDTELQSAISEALAKIQSDGMIGVIEMKWLGSSLDLSQTPKTEGSGQTTDANTGDVTASEGEASDDEEESADTTTITAATASSSQST